MKAEYASRWVDALRSGDFEQGYNALKKLSGRHCCLGVLCELVDGVIWIPENGILAAVFKGVKASAVLPETVKVTAGLTSVNPHASRFLVDLNDSYPRHSFDQIADFIEEHWEEL